MCAPVVTSLNTCSSATLPPSKPLIVSNNSFFVSKNVSSFGNIKLYPPAVPLGIIVIFWTSFAPSNLIPTTAWPASWYATTFFSCSVYFLDFLAGPINTLSCASSISVIVIALLFLLTARSAASFNKFSKSAPLNPTVRFAILFNFTFGAKILFLAWTASISSLPLTSGKLTVTCLSNLPGLNNAGSNTSALFVAAIIIIPSFAPNPSISVSNWFRVCSLSSCPPPRPVPLWRPTASISSINIRHGALCLACLNISRTRLAPTPTNSSTKSEPLI